MTVRSDHSDQIGCSNSNYCHAILRGLTVVVVAVVVVANATMWWLYFKRVVKRVVNVVFTIEGVFLIIVVFVVVVPAVVAVRLRIVSPG